MARLAVSIGQLDVRSRAGDAATEARLKVPDKGRYHDATHLLLVGGYECKTFGA